MNVLVVEDDSRTWQALQVVLAEDGHRPYWASRAVQAIEFLSTDYIDLVLLDIDLGAGNLSGIDVLRMMVEHDKWTEIPVIILSGLPADQIRERAKPTLVNLLRHVRISLEKPIDIAKLRIALARIDNRR
jgi:DNA-binding response OmpR family regulator